MTGGPLAGVMLGAGSIAPHHARAWASMDDVEITAVVDRDVDRARQLVHDHDLRHAAVFASLDAALSAVHADFVDVATPPDLHVEHVLEVAERGLHVLCQKPFTPTLDEAQLLIEACRTAGVRCVVNENWRWRDWYQRIGQLLADGVVGTPAFASFTCHRDLVLPRADGTVPDLLTRQPYTRTMPRLIVLEWGIHLIDVLRMLLGPVTHVWADTSTSSPLVAGEDRALVALRHESGARSFLDISWASVIRDDRRLVRGNVEPFVLEGDRGTIELDPYAGADRLLVTTAAGTVQSDAREGHDLGAAYQRSFDACQRHFVASLRSGRPAQNEASDNAATLAAALAVYESARTGREVVL